jgi:hypothetical protein
LLIHGGQYAMLWRIQTGEHTPRPLGSEDVDSEQAFGNPQPLDDEPSSSNPRFATSRKLH